MERKCCLLVCECLEKEVETIVRTMQWQPGEVEVNTFPGCCGGPDLQKKALNQYAANTEECGQVHILGTFCLDSSKEPDLKKMIPPGKEDRRHFSEAANCAHFIAGRQLVDHYLGSGAYIITPGCLERRQDGILKCREKIEQAD